MSRMWRFFIRTSSFILKEVLEILRQPRLIMTLVLGPFLIMLLVGIGYRNEARALRTLFVTEPGSGLVGEIEQYGTSLGPQLIYAGVTTDQDEALRRLARGEVDLVAVTPNDAYNTIRNSEQGTFLIYHNEVDPFQVEYVRYFGEIYVNEVNRRVLIDITEAGQGEASTVQDDVARSRQSASALRQALEARDLAGARARQRDLNRNLSSVETGVGATVGVLAGVQHTLGDPGAASDADLILMSLAGLQEDSAALDAGNAEVANEDLDYDEDIRRVTEIEEELTLLEDRLAEFRRIDSAVLVSPFHAESRGIAQVQVEVADFYAPAVIVLLLQHLCITFAGLSLVRERQLGTLELFRVAPLSPIETLLGKYISYLIFIGVLMVILTVLVIFALGVPMLGNWWQYVAVIAGLAFTSLSLGFAISLVSQSDSQAVQYSMFVLLASVFFSGFFVQLFQLWAPVRIVSWALPATYGILMLQDVMLRGRFADPYLIAVLFGIGLGLFTLSLLLLRRLMARG